jgi:hypothetical protein
MLDKRVLGNNYVATLQQDKEVLRQSNSITQHGTAALRQASALMKQSKN